MEGEAATSNKRCQELQERLISLVTYSRRKNLKFLNVAGKNSDVQKNCESLISDLCSASGVKVEASDIESAHWIGPKRMKNRPIIVKFSQLKLKDKVLQARSSFREMGITVVQDFPAEVQNRRKIFSSVITIGVER